MNIPSIISTSRLIYPSDSLGEPIQRLMNAEEDLRDAISVASTYAAHGNNAARAARLAAFKLQWDAKAHTILGKKRASEDPTLDANAFSFAMADEVSAALAIVD